MTSLRVGLVGVGYIAEWHVAALRRVDGVTIAGVCDANPDAAARFAKSHGILTVWTTLDALVASGGCDAVHILTPPSSHADLAVGALEGGLHVLLEKPAATSVAECERIKAASMLSGKSVAVSHNFLFSQSYERLRRSVRSDAFGPVLDLDVSWVRELAQARFGPFGAWMLQRPENAVLEVGPHVVSQVIDLVGPPSASTVIASEPVVIPGERQFIRQWTVVSRHGGAQSFIHLGLGSGFPEFRSHVRGLTGSASVDFDGETYTEKSEQSLPVDFARYRSITTEASALKRQARRGLFRYVLGKAKLTASGSEYGNSITASVQAFYDHLGTEPDERQSIDFSTSVIGMCVEIGRLGVAQATASAATRSSKHVAPQPAQNPPEVLITGGTGFIGRALVERFVAAGVPVRVLARTPDALTSSIASGLVDVVRGDLSNSSDVQRSLDGISAVYHLARPNVKTWSDYQRLEIDVTADLAERSLVAGVDRFIYTGTIDSYYAGGATTISDGSPLDPHIERRNLYARAKAASEVLLEQMHTGRGLPLVIFRPGIVIGTGASPFHWGVGMWSGPSVCRLWGDGDHPLPFVLVSETAEALFLARDAQGVIGHALNIIGPPLLTGSEYVAAVARAAHIAIDVRPKSPALFYAGDMAKWAVKVAVRHPGRQRPSYRDWKSRTQRAEFSSLDTQRLLSWSPTTDRQHLIDEGVTRAVIDWFA